MRLTRIFEEIKSKLYAAAFDDNGNVLDQIQDNWSDVSWLEQFFEANKQDLQGGFFGTLSVEDAIERTLEDADELLFDLKEHDGANLDQLFCPLHNDDYRSEEFQKLKAKGRVKHSWMRIYAVRDGDTYIITGGAIKLTRRMQERTHTNEELRKLRIVRDALKLNEADDLFVYIDV